MDGYFEHGRVIAGTLTEHTAAIAAEWITRHIDWDTVAITTCANEHGDVLEAVLATDRADVPAVTQRRQLAGSVPPAPALRARCVIPSCFDDPYHHAAAELADAQDALDELRREGCAHRASHPGPHRRHEPAATSLWALDDRESIVTVAQQTVDALDC